MDDPLRISKLQCGQFKIARRIIMKLTWLDTRTKQWECCDNIWQLMISKLYPDRFTWNPTCPTCGQRGEIGDNYANRINKR